MHTYTMYKYIPCIQKHKPLTAIYDETFILKCSNLHIKPSSVSIYHNFVSTYKFLSCICIANLMMSILCRIVNIHLYSIHYSQLRIKHIISITYLFICLKGVMQCFIIRGKIIVWGGYIRVILVIIIKLMSLLKTIGISTAIGK